jgi:arylformamidase
MPDHHHRTAWLDASLPIRQGMVTFDGDPAVRLELALSIAAGGVCNISRLDFGVHSGTHVDAPVHFIEGAPGAEAIPLDALMGPAVVVDVGHLRGAIDAPDLATLPIPDGATRVLFRGNSGLWRESSFQAAFRGLAPDGARALVDRGVRLVGNDYLSVAPFGDPAPTHRVLLEAGVVIVEGLDLRRIEPGAYDLLCLPLLIPGSDGAPARVLLRPAA